MALMRTQAACLMSAGVLLWCGRLQHEAMLYWCAHFNASVSHEHKVQALQRILWELDAGNVQG